MQPALDRRQRRRLAREPLLRQSLRWVPRRRHVHQVLNVLPGWMALAAGLFILGAVLLVPAWVQNRELAWQVAALERRQHHLNQQLRRYQDCSEAIARGDPAVLTRLAYHVLNLRPADRDLLRTPTDRRLILDPELTRDSILPVDTLLHRGEVPNAPRMPPPPEINSLLIRLTTTPVRLLVASLAGLLILFGLLSPGDPESAEQRRDRGEPVTG